jgi:hypothetical protein
MRIKKGAIRNQGARANEKRHYHHPFDKVFTTLKYLSHPLIIMMISALYGVLLNISSKLRFIDIKQIIDGFEVFSDLMVEIRNYIYHLEFEQGNNPKMSCRMLKYEVSEGLSNVAVIKKKGRIKLPEGLVIFWAKNSKLPDELSYDVSYGNNILDCKIKVFKYADNTLQDLVDKKLIPLVPFYATKFRSEIETLHRKGKLALNAKRLKKVCFYDIIKAIESYGATEQNCDKHDVALLMGNTRYVYNYLYSKYPELQLIEGSDIMSLEEIEKNWLSPVLIEASERAVKADANAANANDRAAKADAKATKTEKELRDVKKEIEVAKQQSKKEIEIAKQESKKEIEIAKQESKKEVEIAKQESKKEIEIAKKEVEIARQEALEAKKEIEDLKKLFASFLNNSNFATQKTVTA